MVALLKSPLRLVPASTESGRERRVFPRKEVRAEVDGLRLDHSVSARQQPRITLSTRDLSVGGLSAIASAPLGVGEKIAVYFPSRGLNPGWDTRGRVIRCEQVAVGYRVAVEFDAMAMAA